MSTIGNLVCIKTKLLKWSTFCLQVRKYEIECISGQFSYILMFMLLKFYDCIQEMLS